MSKKNSKEKLQNEENVGSILYTITDIYKTAKKHFIIFIAIIAAITVLYSGYFMFFTKPLYRSSATLSITPLISSDSKNGTSVYKFNYVSSFAEQMSKTFPYVVESDNLRQAIRYDLGKEINATITADAVVKSNIIQVNIDSPSPDDSYEVMQSFLKTFPHLSEYIIGDTRINIIYQSEKPDKPFNKSTVFTYMLTGMIAGLIVDILVFYLWSLKIETIHDKNDITYKLNSHCISELPHVNVKRNSKNHSSRRSKIAFTDSVFIEAARSSRKRIQSVIGKNDKVIAITSTARHEGKTVTAFSIAKAFADNGHKTLLVDMDFSNRALQGYLLKAPDSCSGVTEYATSEIELSDIAKRYKDNYDIVFAGNKNVKYSHTKIKEFFETAREKYDYIIVDMPSCKLVPNAAAVADLCDDLLFVEKCNSSTITDIKNALKYVLYSKARFIGFILNDYAPTSGGYGYGRYGYSRYGYLGSYRRYGYGYGYSHKYSKYGSRYFDEPENKKEQ